MIRVDVTGAKQLAGDLRSAGDIVSAGIPGVTRATGATLRNLVRVKATTGHHRPGVGHIPGTGPGPNVATGDYRRSIGQETLTQRGAGFVSTESVVSTNAVQANRLEYGFVGADSRGRVYAQPGYPHWAPAAVEIGSVFEAALTKLLDQALAVTVR